MTDDLNTLLNSKEDLDLELKQLDLILQKNNVGINDSLVDREGFPRSDIDIPTIRNTKIKILRLKNDLKELMSKIEQGLIEKHQSQRKLNNSEQDGRPIALMEKSERLKPFLRVGSVSIGSTSFQAGLKEGDLITKFSNYSEFNFEGLQQLPLLLKLNQPIPIQIVRGPNKFAWRYIDLLLNPDPNSNEFKLGCHVNLYKAE